MDLTASEGWTSPSFALPLPSPPPPICMASSSFMLESAPVPTTGEHDEEGVRHLDRLEAARASHRTTREAQSVSMALDGEGDGDVGRGGDGADHAGGVGDARRLGEGLDERGEVDVVVESEDGNHLGRRATAAALLEDLGAARVTNLLRAERTLSLVADADAGLRVRVGAGGVRRFVVRTDRVRGGGGGGGGREAKSGKARGLRRRRRAWARTFMVRRCAGPSSPATLCLPRVDLEAWRPVLCFLLRWPWPEGAGIVADCSPSRAPLAMMKTAVSRRGLLSYLLAPRAAHVRNPGSEIDPTWVKLIDSSGTSAMRPLRPSIDSTEGANCPAGSVDRVHQSEISFSERRGDPRR